MSTKRRIDIHPSNLYNNTINDNRCYYLKRMYNSLIELNVEESNKYCINLKKEIEEKCEANETKFNKRYKYKEEVKKFEIDIDDNEQCRIFKMWYNRCENPEWCLVDGLFSELLREC
jgi:hypothetical protein